MYEYILFEGFEQTVVGTDRFDTLSLLSDSLCDWFCLVIETNCDSLNKKPPDETVAIENSHQKNGTRSRTTRRLEMSAVSSAHTVLIFQPC